jgi:hypothetical protein
VSDLGSLRVRDASKDWALVTRGRLLITVWRTDVTSARIATVDRAVRELTLGNGHYASITVVESGISMRMTEEARDASTSLQRRWAEHMHCSAYLVEGEGFLPAAVRTMTAGMALVTRSPYPVRVFRELPPCAAWVAPHADLDVPAVEQAVTRARLAG